MVGSTENSSLRPSSHLHRARQAEPDGFFSHMAGRSPNPSPSPAPSDDECRYRFGHSTRHGAAHEYDDLDDDEQQFALSIANTPVTETVPRLKAARRATVASSRLNLEPTQSFADLAALGSAMASTRSDSRAEPPRSRPITIQMPGSGRMRSQDPPSAPLSARGDLPGGYFPDHEDPETRVHRPHPFHADVREARRKSIARASEDSSSSPQTASTNGEAGALLPTRPVPPMSSLDPATAPVAPPAPGRNDDTKDTAAVPLKPAPRGAYSYHVDHTLPPSIAAYNPTGIEGNLLPMGKYYPTNWENRKKAKRALKEKESGQNLGHRISESKGRTSRSRSPLGPSDSGSSLTSASSKKAENPAITRAKEVTGPAPPAGLVGHSRSGSEVKRRIQQYQRDMITQATMAASRVLGSQIQQRGSDDVLKTLNTIPTLRNLQLSPPPGGLRSRSTGDAVPSLSASASSLSSASPASVGSGSLAAALAANGHFGILSKPRSPRLQPLGSPGPVTPIDLASNSEEAITSAGGLLAVPRPKMPIAVATAPPAAGPRA